VENGCIEPGAVEGAAVEVDVLEAAVGVQVPAVGEQVIAG
jgi:hypothetical protein